MHTWRVKYEPSNNDWAAWEEGNRAATEHHYRSWRSALAYADINANPMRALQP